MTTVHEVRRDGDDGYRCRRCGRRLDNLTDVARHVVEYQFSVKRNR
jgi:uncharacterized C2H2 Zn-finger protein